MSNDEVVLHPAQRARYEKLKRWYFSPLSDGDANGDGSFSAVPKKAQILAMFENMGLRTPLSPNDPPRALRTSK